jgi:hypothetical protein
VVFRWIVISRGLFRHVTPQRSWPREGPARENYAGSLFCEGFVGHPIDGFDLQRLHVRFPTKTATDSDRKRSGVHRRLWLKDSGFVLAVKSGLGGGDLAHGISLQVEAVGVVDETVEDGVGNGWIADEAIAIPNAHSILPPDSSAWIIHMQSARWGEFLVLCIRQNEQNGGGTFLAEVFQSRGLAEGAIGKPRRASLQPPAPALATS